MNPSLTQALSEPHATHRLIRIAQVGLIAILSLTLTSALTGALAQGFFESHYTELFDDLKIPINTSRYIKISTGSIAILSSLGLMILELWTRRETVIRSPNSLLGLIVAAGLLGSTIALTIIAAWLPLEDQTNAMRITHGLDAAAAALLFGVVCINIDLQRALRWPSWIWIAIALMFIAPLQLADALGGDILGPQGRLLVGGFPACFGLAWTIWHQDNSDPGPVASRGTVLGAFLVMLGAPYLIAQMYVDGEPYVIRAMYYITIFAFAANLVVMLLVGGRNLLKAAPEARSVHALVLVGLLLMLMALLPDYSPSWSSEHRGLLSRVGFDANQGAPAIFMVLLAATLQFLRRNDPRGGPPTWLGYLWLGLLSLYLLTQWYATFQGHYDIRVLKVHNSRLVLQRTRFIHLVSLAYALSLLTLVPSTWRVSRALLRGPSSSAEAAPET